MGRIVGSAIEAAASTTNAVITNAMNWKMTKDTNNANKEINAATNKANADLAAQQNVWNIQQWNRENEYNDPAKQVQRLKGAGLSSAAASQSIEGAGNASPLQSADLANQQVGIPMQAPSFDFSQLLASPLKIMRDYENWRKDKAEATMAEQDEEIHSDMLLTDLDAKKADINLKKQSYDQFAKSFPYTLRSLRYKAEADKRLPALRDLELKNAKANYDLVSENVNLAKQQFSWLEKMHDTEFDIMVQKLKNAIAEEGEIKSRTNANNAAAAASSAQAENLKEQTVGQKIENQGKKLENRSKLVKAILDENGAPEDVASRVGVLIQQGILSADNITPALNGTRLYVRKGHEALYVDPLTRQFLFNFWDKGSSSANQWSGSMFNGLDNIFSSRSYPLAR